MLEIYANLGKKAKSEILEDLAYCKMQDIQTSLLAAKRPLKNSIPDFFSQRSDFWINKLLISMCFPYL